MCISPIINPTTLFMDILSKSDWIFGGNPYLPSIFIMSMLLGVSNEFTGSSNSTQVGILWLCRRCSNVVIVNSLSGHPTPGVDSNWYLTPCFLLF